MQAFFFILFVGYYSLFVLTAKTVDIEPQYQKYVDAFELASEQAGHKITVNNIIIETSDSLDKEVIAQCRPVQLSGTPKIVVGTRWWPQQTEEQHELTIFHELGHCILRRGHDESLGSDGYPASIMYPYELATQLYISHREQYIKELFSK